MKHEKVTIKIPRPLYNRVHQLIEDSGFNSPTDFIVYVLRDVLSERSVNHTDRFSPEELVAIKDKLRRLGYLD
ncbi:MAG TPA: CopG family transcriptional regulator [Candidatus Krumholzibacteria bacterium]